MMKLSQLSIATLFTVVASAAFAQAKAPEPDYNLSYNVGLTTDYRYRGISQTSRKPAVQGGLDFAHKNGLYIGAWASSIDWIKDDGKTAAVDAGNTRLELDIYGGYKGSAGPVSYDIGLLQYVYPGNKYVNIGANANTLEAYGALTYGPVTAKYSHSLSNTFGFANSKNSYYFDLSASFDLGGGYTLVPHVGRQLIKNTAAASYTDYSLTVSKDFGSGIAGSLAYVDTNTKAYVTSKGKDKGKAALVAAVKYSF
jgi:uncharacterized protein (TIGR02001 family)